MRAICTATRLVRWLLPFFLFTFLLSSCETDSYEKGEGDYSLMLADFCEFSVNTQKQGVSFVTDDGDSYELVPPYTASWIATADTTYRTIIYYNKVAAAQAEIVSIGTVATLEPIEHWRMEEQPQDPIDLESAWLSRSGKYLNLGLLMKTGRISDEELPHTIALAQDTIYTRPDGKHTAVYRFLHSQNGLPEYYTNRRYVSILLPIEKPDTILFSLQTYEGNVERIFIP